MVMRHGRSFLLGLMFLLIGACDARTSQNASESAANPPVQPTDKEVPAMNNESQKATEIQPPSPSSVL